MGKQARQWARKRRDELIEELGGKCFKCGVEDGEGRKHRLQFDHIDGKRTWEASKVEWSARISRYSREIKKGLIQLLCPKCNQIKGCRHERYENGAEIPF